MMETSLRQRLGCWLHERWQTELLLRFPKVMQLLGMSWLDLRNRGEKLRLDLDTGGRSCEWTDSSRLTVARVFPQVASRLLSFVLREWPIRFHDGFREETHLQPVVSILIPIGGADRLKQFEMALMAARAQIGVTYEIVVVEQSKYAQLHSWLPADVRYLHQSSDCGADFNKSRALNAAAREARGEVLLILDGDFLIPVRFASECARTLQRVEAVRPARLIFNLDRSASERLLQTLDTKTLDLVESVVANAPNPMAVRRSTYWKIGGHDEAYDGWGGEDLEFLDRLRTRDIAEGGWMPVLHVWHAPAPKKANGDRNRALHEAKMTLPPCERIAALCGAFQ